MNIKDTFILLSGYGLTFVLVFFGLNVFWALALSLIFSLLVLSLVVNRLKQLHQKEREDLIQRSRSHERYSQVQSSQLASIVLNLPFPIALLNLVGEYVLTNTAFNALYDHVPQLYSEDSLDPEISSFVRQAYLREEALIRNVHIGNMDYQAMNVPVVDERRYNGSLLMFLDITRLLEGERIQKRFIADASHELKTPLTAILGMVEILNRPEFKDDKTQHEFLVHIEEEAKRMDRILKDLLDLSRLSATKIALNKVNLALKPLVKAAHQSVAQSFKENHNTFSMDIDQNFKVYGDPDKLHHILTNLLMNASKFTTHGEVTVRGYAEGLHNYIEVKDTGIGIDSKDLDSIFDRFVRLDASRSRQSGGSGLGLAIVKAYVEMHQGKISVKSQVGQGSTFIIELPKE